MTASGHGPPVPRGGCFSSRRDHPFATQRPLSAPIAGRNESSSASAACNRCLGQSVGPGPPLRTDGHAPGSPGHPAACSPTRRPGACRRLRRRDAPTDESACRGEQSWGDLDELAYWDGVVRDVVEAVVVAVVEAVVVAVVEAVVVAVVETVAVAVVEAVVEDGRSSCGRCGGGAGSVIYGWLTTGESEICIVRAAERF